MSCEVYFDLYKDIVFAIITSDHLYHQESLLKITHTLTMKNEEISNFVCTLKQSLDNLEVKWQIYLWTSVVCLFAFFSIQCRCFFYLLSLFFFFTCHQANSTRVQEDLQAEFTTLQSVLDEMKDNMLTRIKQERATRTYELQVLTTFPTVTHYWSNTQLTLKSVVHLMWNQNYKTKCPTVF